LSGSAVEAEDGNIYELKLGQEDSRFLFNELQTMYETAGDDPLD
jgi:hypothetical protein